jgi:hypothetical protein
MPAYSKPYSHYTWSEFISTDFSDLTWADSPDIRSWAGLAVEFGNA